MFNLSFLPQKKKQKLHKINSISNPSQYLNPDFVHSFAKMEKEVIGWEYVYLTNGKEYSSYHINKKQLKHVEITHEILLSEIMGYVQFVVPRKQRKSVQPLVEFSRLETFAKRLNMVSIVVFYDGIGNKYEFAMRLVYKNRKRGKK